MKKKTPIYRVRVVTKSSLIKRFGYSRPAKKLIIEFLDGNQYAYKKVPLDVYKTFLEAKSYGAFYNRRIKGEYESEKLT